MLQVRFQLRTVEQIVDPVEIVPQERTRDTQRSCSRSPGCRAKPGSAQWSCREPQFAAFFALHQCNFSVLDAHTSFTPR